MCHTAFSVTPSCMMIMMMTRTAANIFTRYWMFHTSQSVGTGQTQPAVGVGS